MAAPKGPTSRRVHLGKVLEKMRDDLKLRREDVATELGFSPEKLWRVEKGRTGLPNPKDLRALLTHYGVRDSEVIDSLLLIHRESLSEAWWTPYTPHLTKGMREYVGMESDALSIAAWQPTLVFGLLQTKEYARALLMSAKTVDETTTEFIEANVELRMDRKKLITSTEPRDLWIIMGEDTLRSTIGSREVMAEQYNEIKQLAALDHITVQILPAKSTGYRASQNFILLDMGDPLGKILQADQPSGQASVTDKKPEVGRYGRRFDALRAAALDPNETPSFIDEIQEELERKK
ncbi:helix-turn-helix domain-containing protein [Streptomyces rubiginosohelvolus]|uniref:helix-turn-helix domain-containing protein n=1 Tax=Streptomyces rubiginosohelvolus TaxID=67362 RepID=UPI0035D91E86